FPSTTLFRSLTGRQVAVVGGEVLVLVEEGRLDDEQVAALGERVHPLAQPGVHDEGERLPTPWLADVLQPDAVEDAVPLEAADVRARDAVCGEPVREHAAPVGLG